MLKPNDPSPIMHHTCLPVHGPPTLSGSHKLCARLAGSTAEIWDACNYRAIYSNQLDPNLNFPQDPGRAPRLLLPPRKRFFAFLFYFIFSSGLHSGVSSCDSSFKDSERFQSVNTDRPFIQTMPGVGCRPGNGFFLSMIIYFIAVS